MTKRKRKITIGELQAKLGIVETQRDNAIKLLNKSKMVIERQEKIIRGLREERSLLHKLKKWFKSKWKK